ncbi:dienelactone hydrolase family protein [Acuticoccus kandeliae]|uniref:dienelactone hydrolase family protein n=1 Tax=Acuticoccus kandeliae TaxID=2073160 RepID=UPI000D3E425A|nr:dienelactone hydrolase family protein [Acuticoccus kandeliae]
MTHTPPGLRAVLIALVLTAFAGAARADLAPSGDWPSGAARGERVPVESANPFSLVDVGAADADPVAADVTFYPAAGASAAHPAPAVILLHGAGGVSDRREGRYAREFAAQGVAVAVIDVFAARGGGRFIERLMNTTEAMALSDAFATLDWLAARPDVDGARVALIGFSYGGMSSVYSAYRQVVDTYRPANRFAAHVAFYGPCIARFEDPTTTGAPILMLWGDEDAIMDPAACETLAGDLRRGGSDVGIRRYDARHRWDGAGRSWRAPVHIADCRFNVGTDGTVRDTRTMLEMTNAAMRATILAFCSNRDGYLIGGDEAVRRQSNAALAQFLNPILFPDRDT